MLPLLLCLSLMAPAQDKDKGKEKGAEERTEKCKSKDKDKDEKPKAPQLSVSDVPAGWESRTVVPVKNGAWLGTFQRKDYKLFKLKALSTEHVSIVIIGRDKQTALGRVETALAAMRKNQPNAFRIATPVEDHVWVLTQGLISDSLSDNGILRARGEVSASHQQVIDWIKVDGRIRLLMPSK